MDKLPTKKLPITLFIGGAFLIALVILLSSKLPILSLSSQSQLAQIIAIEIELLRKWQQNGSLKNNLAYNSEGSDVALLQRMLSQDSVAYPEKKITGYYGELTLRAVKRIQKEYGLAQTGIIDSPTRKKLNDVFLSHLCPEPTATYPDLSMQMAIHDSPLPLDYVPPLLVDISSKVRTAGIICLRSDIVPYIEKMFADAKWDDVELMITSGYRKPEIQKYLYDFWIEVEGYSAINEVALPGFSEHQLGTTVDLTDSSIRFSGVDDRFAYSKGGKWLRENAHTYGFVMSFPENRKGATGFTFEPWHWRYVGVDTATALHGSRSAYVD